MFHDLTPIHELVSVLPPGASVFTDKGHNSADDEATILAETQVRLIPIRRRNMQPNSWDEEMDLHRYRKSIETVNSQLEKRESNIFMLVLVPALTSKFMPHSWPWLAPICPSNQGKESITDLLCKNLEAP